MTNGGKADKWAARSARLSAALRENLKRRKEQARARVGGKARGEEPEPSAQETDAASDSPCSEPKN